MVLGTLLVVPPGSRVAGGGRSGSGASDSDAKVAPSSAVVDVELACARSSDKPTPRPALTGPLLAAPGQRVMLQRIDALPADAEPTRDIMDPDVQMMARTAATIGRGGREVSRLILADYYA